MTCQNIAADRCTISLSLKVGKLAARTKLVSIGSAKGTVVGGKRANLKVKLTHKGKQLLARRQHLKVTATGKSRNRAGVSVPLKTTLKLKAKPAKRR